MSPTDPRAHRTHDLPLIGFALPTLLLACSTSYTPKPSPRVAVVSEGFVRDGKTIEGGFFGEGLVDAVQTVPEARDHAVTYRNLTIAGFVVNLLGAGAAGAGVGLWVGNQAKGEVDQTIETASVGLMIGGLATSIVGLSLQLAGEPHFLDAMNIYNDTVAPPGPDEVEPWAPRSSTSPAPTPLPTPSVIAPAPPPAPLPAAPAPLPAAPAPLPPAPAPLPALPAPTEPPPAPSGN